MSLQTWFNQVWYERRHAPAALLPASWVFGGLTLLRRALYQVGLLRSVRLPVPVIVVGNLTVGGTGKTPLVCWLGLELAARARKPGIVTRGYGGAATAPRLVLHGDRATLVGDEAVLLSERTRLPVAVGRDRPAAAQLLIGAGCDVILSDDGLQHLALRRDCEIAVIDGARGFGNGELLPAGPLRESPDRLTTVDIVVVNGGGSVGGEGALHMRLEGDQALALRGERRKALSEWAGIAIHAVAGIGHPQRFFNSLRAYGIVVDGRGLPDHARLSAADIDFGDAEPVLLTEKDAVKCAEFADDRHWYVPVSAVFESKDREKLLSILEGKLAMRSHG
jgi:tetraacyldisaccharide 4'-kinase